MNRETLTSSGLLILRVSFSCFMMVHGWEKFSNFEKLMEIFPDPLGMGNRLSLISAIGTELCCSIFLLLGLGTRIVAIPLAFTMAVALFGVHIDDPWKKQELAACYLAVYVAIIFLGGGNFSLDHFWFGRKTNMQ